MENVVLLDEGLNSIGSADKYVIHTDQTPLHLAFSCYLTNDHGQILLSRRALSKQTWPGVWTNSFCGHPGPGEERHDAVHRRAKDELGTTVTDVKLIDPDFRYTARDASGILENEWCPIFAAKLAGDIDLNPDEIVEYTWVDLDTLVNVVSQAPALMSPWSVLQVPRVAAELARITS